MKISVEFLGFPMISDVIGKTRLELAIAGNTVKDVIDELVRTYGEKIRNSFYDENGRLDVTIQMMLNGKSLTLSGKDHTPLNDGDTVTFMLLLAGG